LNKDHHEPLRVLELRTVRGTGGGPEKTILLGTARTDRARYEVTICYIRDARDDIFHIDERATALPLDYVEIVERHSFDRAIWPALRTFVRQRRFDIVHAHDYKTDLLASLLGRYERTIPLATAHGWTGQSWRETRLYYPADRWLLARFPRVIAVSSDIRNALLRAGAEPERVDVVLNGIDADRFVRHRAREREARARWQIGEHDVVLGSVGRLEPQKRFDLLIEAYAVASKHLPNVSLVIAGDGSLRQLLTGRIAALGLGDRCRLLGHVDDIALLHHAFDVFVQSSDYEGTPNAVLEAMALETPVVATEAGGTAELARNQKEALIVPIGDVDSLARALVNATADPVGRHRRAIAARRRVENELSFNTRMRKVERVYDELARSCAKR
jgi:glycosyltransferase involved in cell wall biosynthesis